MDSFRPSTPGAGAAGSCGCGTRCPALAGGSCRCGCACLLDSRDARRALAEQMEREETKSTKNPPHDDAAAAATAAQALAALSGQQQHPSSDNLSWHAKKKSGSGGGCCGGAGKATQTMTTAAGSSVDAQLPQREKKGELEEEARDAELEGIAAVVAAAVGAPLAGEKKRFFVEGFSARE